MKALDWIFRRFGGQGFGFGPPFLFPMCHGQLPFHFRVPRASVVSVSLSINPFSIVSLFFMVLRQELAASKA